MAAQYEKHGAHALRALDEKVAAAAGAADEESRAAAVALAGIVWTPSMRRMYTLLDRCVLSAY